jgi:hypothetical protein
MNIKQQRAALAKLSPKKAAAAPEGEGIVTTLRDGTVNLVGAAVPSVKSFFSDIATSYRYHEAVRKGQL